MRWFPHIALVLASGSACGTLAGFEDFEGDGGAPNAGGPSRSYGGSGGMAGSRDRAPTLPAGAPSGGGASPSGGAAPSRAGSSSAGQGGRGGSSGMFTAGSGGRVPAGAGASGASVGGSAGSLVSPVAGAAGQGGDAGEDVGGCGKQLLQDGAFDALRESWEVTPFLSLPVIVPASDSKLLEAGVMPHSGDHLAWLGGVPDTESSHYVTLDQRVTVPQEVIELVLSGQLRIRTEELPDRAYDRFVIQIMDDDENVLWLANIWSNLDATADWTAFEFGETDLATIRGKTVIFRVESHTDSHTVTDFWVDSLRLEADCDR